MAVEEVEEEPTEGDKARLEHYCAPERWKHFSKTAQEELIDRREREDALRHIDGYGVQADNGERFCPTLTSADIDNIVEKCEHRKAICAHDKHK